MRNSCAIAIIFVVMSALLLSGCGGGVNSISKSATPNTTAAVTIMSPLNGSTVGSPVRIIMSASSSHPVSGMKVFVDGQPAFQTAASKVDTQLQLSPGKHQVIGRASDTTQNFQNAVDVTVSSPADASNSTPPPAPPAPAPSGPAIPANARVFSHIEEMPGWRSCTVCAGANGQGPVAPYSMTQGVSSPSMDGNSAHFWLGGRTPFSAALWYKQLGGDNSVRHFVYDVHYYVKDPGSSQALEFDVNQGIDSEKYIFGTQCDLKGRGRQWDVWDTAGKAWIHTGVPCRPPSANSWHHLIWELERTTDHRAHFIAFTLDGVRHPVDMYFHARSMQVYELNVAFQMDGDHSENNYDVWLDQVKLSAW